MDISPYIMKLDRKKVRNICGIGFDLVQCGERRWLEDKLIGDEITVQVKGAYGRTEDRKIHVPIRFWNFSWSLHEIQKNYPHLGEVETIEKAMRHAELNCFDPTGEPNNMATRLGYTSYSKFLETFQGHFKKDLNA